MVDSALDRICRSLSDAIGKNNGNRIDEVLSNLSTRDRAAVMCRPVFPEGMTILQHALLVGRKKPSVEAFSTILKHCTAAIVNVPESHHGDRAQFLSLEAGDEYLKALMNMEGVSWGVTDVYSNTPLARVLQDPAIKLSRNSLVDLSKKYPVAVWQVNKVGENILHAACRSDDAEKVLFALDAPKIIRDGADASDVIFLLTGRNHRGDTPMHSMCQAKNPRILQTLATCVETIDNHTTNLLLEKNREGRSVIYKALEAQNPMVAEMCKGNPQYQAELAMSALELNDQSILPALLERRERSPEERNTVRNCMRAFMNEPERLIDCLNSAAQDNNLTREKNAWFIEASTDFLETVKDRAMFVACAAASGNRELVNAAIAAHINRKVPTTATDKLPEKFMSSLRDNKRLQDPRIFKGLAQMFPNSELLSDPGVISELLAANPEPEAIIGIVSGTEGETRARILKAISERDSQGVSPMSRVIHSCHEDRIRDFLEHTLAQSSEEGKRALKMEMSRSAIELSRTGQTGKIGAVLKVHGDAVYSEDRTSGKSILEVASDAGQVDTVRFLIGEHRKIVQKAEKDASETHLQNAINSIVQVAKVDPAVAGGMLHDVHRSGAEITLPDLQRILNNAVETPSEDKLEQVIDDIIPEIVEKINRKRLAQETGKSVARQYLSGDSTPPSTQRDSSRDARTREHASKPALGDYGFLHQYVDGINGTVADTYEFKKKVLKKNFENVDDFRNTSHGDGKGHSIFTLVASIGVPSQMDALISSFETAKRNSLAFSTNLSSFSSLGSPLQCAIISNNDAMVHHMFKKMDQKELHTQYGERQDNLLHTLVRHGKLDTLTLLHNLYSGGRASANVVQALEKKDADGKTPIDLALSKDAGSYSALCSFIEGTVDEKGMERLLGSSSLTEQAIQHRDPYLLQWIFRMANQFNAQQEDKGSTKRVSVLGNPAYMSELVVKACQNTNPGVHRALLNKIREECPEGSFPIMAWELLEHLAEKNVYNAELFDSLAVEAQEALSNPDSERSFVEKAALHDNPDLIRHIPVDEVLKYLDPTRLLEEGKDNLLGFFLKNAKGDTVRKLGNTFVDKMIKSPNMPKTWEAYLNKEYPTPSVLELAILSNNLQLVESLLTKAPELIMQVLGEDPDTDLPYAVAAKHHPENRLLLQLLARQTVDFLLEREEARSGEGSHEAEQEPELSPASAQTIRGMLLRHNLDLSTAEDDALERCCTRARAGTALFERAGSENALRIALESGNQAAAEKLLEEHARNPGNTSAESIKNIINQQVNGRSILHLAALNGNHKILTRLMELGGDHTLTGNKGENIAHLCTQSGMKAEDGSYVFESLIRTQESRAGLSNNGILERVAACPDYKRTVEMLELIQKNPELDGKLGKLSGKKQQEYLRSVLTQASLNRKDTAIDDFLASSLTTTKKKAADPMVELLQNSTTSLNGEQLANLLTKESKRFFTEVYPIELARAVVGASRSALIAHQKTLFDIINSRAISGPDFDKMRQVPIDAFSAVNWRIRASPLEYAIATKNLEFIKYALEHRGSEIRPNICNADGANLPAQLSELMVEDPAAMGDPHFRKLYCDFLENSKCITKTAGAPVRAILGRNPETPRELLDLVDRIAAEEHECSERLSNIEAEFNRSYEPRAVKALSRFVRDNGAFARNSANPFRTLFSSAMESAVSTRSGLSDTHKSYIRDLIKDKDTRSLLTNVDSKGNNALQSLFDELSATKVGIGQDKANVVQELCSEVLEHLGKEDPGMLEDVFLRHRNARGENCLETLASVNPSYNAFRAIERKLGSKKIAELCDLNTALVRAANQSALQRHIYENYAVFPVGGCDVERNVRVHNAAISGEYDAFIAAMKTGGNINLLDQDGNTPLHSLLIHMMQNRGNIKQGHLKILETLVSHGAALHHENKAGFSVCDIAKPLVGSLFGKHESCLQLIAEHRREYHKLRKKAQEDVDKHFVKNRVKGAQQYHHNISGATLDVKLGTETLLVSKLLNSDLCNQHNLSAIKLNFNDGQDQGEVEKVGNKRNYTVSKGVIELDLSWKAHGKEQKVSVEISADGTIKVAQKSLQQCGAGGEWLDFTNCKVYVGGLSLEEALRRGIWKAKSKSATLTPDTEARRPSQQSTEPAPSTGSERGAGAEPGQEPDEEALASERQSYLAEELSSLEESARQGAAGGAAVDEESQGVIITSKDEDVGQEPEEAALASERQPHSAEELSSLEESARQGAAGGAAVDEEPGGVIIVSEDEDVGQELEEEAFNLARQPYSSAELNDLGYTMHPVEDFDYPQPEQPVFATTTQLRTGGATRHTASITPGKEVFSLAALGDNEESHNLAEEELSSNARTRTAADNAQLRDYVDDWSNMLRVCGELKSYYAFNTSENSDAAQASDDLALRWSELKKSEPDKEKRKAIMEEKIPEIMQRHNIECIKLGNPILRIKNGAIEDNGTIPWHFSSPYGFGNNVDRAITGALRKMQSVSDKSLVDCTVDVELYNLPILASAVIDVEKTPPRNIDFRNPANQEEGERIFKDIINLSMLYEDAQITKRSTGAQYDTYNLRPTSRSEDVESLTTQSSAAEESDRETTPSSPDDAAQPWWDPAGDGVSYSEHARSPARSESEFADSEFDSSESQIYGKDSRSSSESTAEAMSWDNFDPIYAREYHKDTSENRHISSLAKWGVPAMAEGAQNTTEMLKNLILQEDSGQPPASKEMLAWQRICGACKNVGTFYAFNTSKNSDVLMAADDLESRMKDISEINNVEARKNATEEAVEEVMKQNNIECARLGNPTLEINNGVITNANDIGIPHGFSSPFGFGDAVDGIIKSSLEDIAEISDRSSTNCNLKIQLQHLPMVAAAVVGAEANPPMGKLPPLGVGDNTPIPQQDGERLLKDIVNMSMLHDEAHVASKAPRGKIPASTMHTLYKIVPDLEGMEYSDSEHDVGPDTAERAAARPKVFRQRTRSSESSEEGSEVGSRISETDNILLKDAIQKIVGVGLSGIQQDLSSDASSKNIEGKRSRSRRSSSESVDSDRAPLSQEELQKTLESCGKDMGTMELDNVEQIEQQPLSPTPTPTHGKQNESQDRERE
ncbi:MAG: hypothetical protein ACTJLL_00590 [Anaplasma sp.]